MKPAFYNRGQRFGAQCLFFLLGATVASVPLAVRATDPSWTSSGSVSSPINIDATNFYNSDTWNIFTPKRFTTAATLNYTNTGTMNSIVGWDFSWHPVSAGSAHWSSTFLNKFTSSKITASGIGLNFITTNGIGSSSGWLWISATNIINQGQLI